jgi:hypothetical protein
MSASPLNADIYARSLVSGKSHMLMFLGPQRWWNSRHVPEGSARHSQSALREDALDPYQYERASPRTILNPIPRVVGRKR